MADNPQLSDGVILPDLSDDLLKMQTDGIEENVSQEIFSVYHPSPIIPGAKIHPGDIVEAGSLSVIKLPSVTYDITKTIPREVITSCKLSNLQLEGIIYACQRHQLHLPNNKRAGFFLGDGAGVGKGRQIAGIILDNYARGRTRHVWFSVSSDLRIDAKRDLTDINCHIKVINGCRELDRETRVFGLSLDFKEGIVFSTYSTLVSSVYRKGSNNKTRLQQLVDWCGGENFAGCLIFDECHKAKKFIPGKESSSTKVAMAVMTIQSLLPKARVVYCSATGVSDVKNMAFMERLGLWGHGCSFDSFDHFLKTVHKKGLGIAEMLAMEMKSAGMYLSRGLSFKETEFMNVECPLSEDQVKVYDKAVLLWREIKRCLEVALVKTCNGSRVWSTFWGCHQRFFKQLCIGMKVPFIVTEAKKALAEGYSVVIGLQSTGEASLESELGKNKFVSSFLSLCREIVVRFVEQNFPTLVKTEDIMVLEDEWCKLCKVVLLESARKIILPNSPLDDIIDQLGGPTCVAEMTGRHGRIIRLSSKDSPHYELRGTDSDGVESLNVKERNLFMAGKKLIAIISDAASTGISLHADLTAANKRRRVHLTVELPWSADKAVQQMGRSHRSNQSSGPLYKLLITNLGGERRFAAAVCRRLQALGALTKGDRRAATGADISEYNFDNIYGRTALRSMYNAIFQNVLVAGIQLPSVRNIIDLQEFNFELKDCLFQMGLVDEFAMNCGIGVKEKDAGDVSRFFNRILGLPVDKQNMVFNYFCECMNAAICAAKKEGRYNDGMLDLTAQSIEMVRPPTEIFNKINLGPCSTKHTVLKINRGMPWEKALQRAQNYTRKNDGFYMSRREMFGKHMYLLATEKENSPHLFRIARPNTGLSAIDEDINDLFYKYSSISIEKAEKEWQQHYIDSHKHCMHGSSCKLGASCTVGKCCYDIHLLSGGTVNLMTVLETVLAKNAASLSKYETNLRVVCVKLNNGERIVGIQYPEMLLSQVEKMQQQLQNKISINGIITSQDMQTLPQHPTIESASPVANKCLTKAITAPVTIKTFFKSVEMKLDLDSNVETKDIKPSVTHCQEDSNDCSIISVSQNVQSENNFSENEPPKKKKKQSILNFSTVNVSLPLNITCPICSSSISKREINRHIENCLQSFPKT